MASNSGSRLGLSHMAAFFVNTLQKESMDTAIEREDAGALSSVAPKRRLPRRRKLVFDTAVVRDDRKGLTSVHKGPRGEGAFDDVRQRLFDTRDQRALVRQHVAGRLAQPRADGGWYVAEPVDDDPDARGPPDSFQNMRYDAASRPAVLGRLRAEHERRGEEALAGSQLERMLAGDGRLARHAQHHSRAHMKAMKVAISNGLNFDQGHRWALRCGSAARRRGPSDASV